MLLAAIDDSTAAAPVLEVATAMAAALGTTVEALHVPEGDRRGATEVAARAGITLRFGEGDPSDAIVAAAADPAVLMVVVGAHGEPAGPRPVGHVALAVIDRADTPVLVVPRDVTIPDGSQPLRAALIPIEGSAESYHAVASSLHRLRDAGVELTGLQVFDARHTPQFWDERGLPRSAGSPSSSSGRARSRWCSGSGAVRRRARSSTWPPRDGSI